MGDQSWMQMVSSLASHLESCTPIEVTRHGRTIGLYVRLPQESYLCERERLMEAGRRMQAELQQLCLTEEDLAVDFQAWRRNQQPELKA